MTTLGPGGSLASSSVVRQSFSFLHVNPPCIDMLPTCRYINVPAMTMKDLTWLA